MNKIYYESEIGTIEIRTNGDAISSVSFRIRRGTSLRGAQRRSNLSSRHSEAPKGPKNLKLQILRRFAPQDDDVGLLRAFGARNDGKTVLPILQIDEYFRGKRKNFSLRLKLAGTLFQKRIWALTRKIPFGKTVSYSELARRAGIPRGARAVARALSKNPAALLVPCHRVIAGNGELSGFAWGVSRKKKLLGLEAARD